MSLAGHSSNSFVHYEDMRIPPAIWTIAGGPETPCSVFVLGWVATSEVSSRKREQNLSGHNLSTPHLPVSVIFKGRGHNHVQYHVQYHFQCTVQYYVQCYVQYLNMSAYRVHHLQCQGESLTRKEQLSLERRYNSTGEPIASASFFGYGCQKNC